MYPPISHSFLLYLCCGILGAGTFSSGFDNGTGNISNLGTCILPGVGTISGCLTGSGSLTGSGCLTGSGPGSILIGSGTSIGVGISMGKSFGS